MAKNAIKMEFLKRTGNANWENLLGRLKFIIKKGNEIIQEEFKCINL